MRKGERRRLVQSELPNKNRTCLRLCPCSRRMDVSGGLFSKTSGAVDHGLRVGLGWLRDIPFEPRVSSEATVTRSIPCHRSPYTYARLLPSFLLFHPSPMSTSTTIPRPPSRSERLLRDTLRKDDTLRTHGAHSSRPRSASSNCDDDDDEDFFQSAILFRCSSHRSSAASALGHGHSTGFYVPDGIEHASYSRLLRSSSSGSSRSGRSGCNSSPRPAYTQEKQEELSRLHDTAPHEAVLRNRLDSVIHSMRIDKDRGAVDVSLCAAVFGSYSSRHDRH